MASARAWLEAREPAEEVLIIGGSLDAANEVVRGVAQTKGAATDPPEGVRRILRRRSCRRSRPA
jgi:hypothetical protein